MRRPTSAAVSSLRNLAFSASRSRRARSRPMRRARYLRLDSRASNRPSVHCVISSATSAPAEPSNHARRLGEAYPRTTSLPKKIRHDSVMIPLYAQGAPVALAQSRSCHGDGDLVGSLFILPRLFVYHADASDPFSGVERFRIMERRLFTIMTVGALATLVFGIAMPLPSPADHLWVGCTWLAPGCIAHRLPWLLLQADA